MSEIQTAYNPGGFTISSERAPGGAGGGGIDSFFLDLIKKKKAWEDAFNQRRLAAMDADLGDRARARQRGTNVPGEKQRDPMQNERDAAERAKLRAQYMTPGQLGIMNPDPTYGDQFMDKRMSGADRQAFLPQSAGVANQGMSAAEVPEAETDQAIRLMREREDAATRAAQRAAMGGPAQTS